MKRINIIQLLICVIIGVSLPSVVRAQQDPMYTQYMFNTQTINPAYAGTWNSVGFLALSRHQWLGIQGAPSTQTFSFQMPLRSEKVGLGLNLVNDKIGLENRFGLFADYSFRVSINPNTNLWMGLKGGFTNYSHNLSEHVLYPEDRDDPMFMGEIEHKWLPNAGVGFYLLNPSYYVGLSVPKIIHNQYEGNNENLTVYGDIRHFFLIAGSVHELSRDIKFKPTLLAKATVGAPLEVDITANLLFKEKFWIGAMVRTGDSFGFIAQWIIDQNLRLGYAIDFPTTNLRGKHFNTHEIMISYELKIVKQKIISPRYF
jgi:type IX secretion system PorP/SprF family membrane protein